MNQVVIITGAGSGLGRALAHAYAERSACLLLADYQEEGLAALAALLQQRGVSLLTELCDVRQADAVTALVQRAVSAWGRLDVMINNAGVAVSGPLVDVSAADWHWVMDINFYGVLHGCQAAARVMQAQGHGHIINIASMAGLLNPPEMAAYNASKAAVVSLSETLAAEMAVHGVAVHLVCPGFFATGLGRSLRSTRAGTGAALERLMRASPLDADAIAARIISACERGEACLLPHPEGRWHWRLKRWWPAAFRRRMQAMAAAMAARATRQEKQHGG